MLHTVSAEKTAYFSKTVKRKSQKMPMGFFTGKIKGGGQSPCIPQYPPPGDILPPTGGPSPYDVVISKSPYIKLD